MTDPIFFGDAAAFRAWLAEHHDEADELFVGFYKKSSDKTGIAYPDARDEALCFGWIDGHLRRIDDERHQLRFTPRRPNSVWSKVNVERFAALEAEGRMTDAGRAAWERRRADRTGIYSFEQDGEAVLPPVYEARLRANAAAAAFFDAQPPGYRRNSIYFVVSAKREETRERRLERLIADSAAGVRIKEFR
jgi:uncharacterized protein YdeI (YjbR/CyaY-like superfamily)